MLGEDAGGLDGEQAKCWASRGLNYRVMWEPTPERQIGCGHPLEQSYVPSPVGNKHTDNSLPSDCLRVDRRPRVERESARSARQMDGAHDRVGLSAAALGTLRPLGTQRVHTRGKRRYSAVVVLN